MIPADALLVRNRSGDPVAVALNDDSFNLSMYAQLYPGYTTESLYTLIHARRLFDFGLDA